MVEGQPISVNKKLDKSAYRDSNRRLADNALLGLSFLAGYSAHEITQDPKWGVIAGLLSIVIIKGILKIGKEAENDKIIVIKDMNGKR